MHIVSRQEGVLNKVARTFKRQQHDKHGKWVNGYDSVETHVDLLDLGATPTKVQIDDIVGHSWTDFLCDECHKDAEYLVALRDGKKVIKVCRNCLNSALKLLNKETK